MKKLSIEPIIIFIILVIIFAASALFFRNEANKNNEKELDTVFSIETQELVSFSEQLFSEYSKILTAARGLFISSQVVTRKEWEDFISSLEIEKNYPSVTRLAYIKKVKATDKTSYVNSVRTDTSVVPEGFPNFQIFPPSERDELFIAHFVEPLEGAQDLLGFDFTSESIRFSTMELARDTNSVVMTEPIVLLKEEQDHKSFLMFLPVYRAGVESNTLEQRRENLEGFILLASTADDFAERIAGSSTLVYTDIIQIDDVTSQPKSFLPQFYTTQPDELQTPHIHEKVARKNIGTRTWLFTFTSIHEHVLSDFVSYLPGLIFTLGVVVSGLVSFSLYNFSKLSNQAEAMAEDLTKDLRKYQLAVHGISEQIVITDSDGMVIYANPATEKITGYRTDEILGTKAGKLWGGLMPMSFYEKMWQVIKTNKQSYVSELTNKRKNGEVYQAEIRISPILGKDGVVEFFVASERDTSGEKKVDEIKTQFISLASHQLRTPLSSMKWNMEMLLKGDVGQLQPEQTNLLKSLYQSIQRMITLVNNLLNVSRIESGRIIINPKPTNVISLVLGVIDEIKLAAEKQKVKIITDFSDAIADVSIDQQLIREVYRNILTNAVKYSPNGGVVTIKIRQSEGYILSEISDTGLGIPVKDQNAIFEKFHRGSNVFQTETDGNGLGLYMTKIIIESSNGKIWFESVEGKGTTFWFTIPVGDVVEKRGIERIEETDAATELHSELIQ